MIETVWDVQKRFLLPRFVVFSPENEQLALLWDENDIVGNWHVWSNDGSNADGLHLVLHPLCMGSHSMLHSIWESNICFILRIEIRKVAEILRTDSLEDENSIVRSFLLSQHSMTPGGRLFFLISWTETWSVMLVHLNKKCYFSLRMVCLWNLYIDIWNLWFILMFKVIFRIDICCEKHKKF